MPELIAPLWLSSNSFFSDNNQIFFHLPWSPDRFSEQSVFHYQELPIHWWAKGILISVTFVVNNLVILSRPNKMRIWLCLGLIIKSGGEQTLCIAIDHVWRQAYTQSIPTANEKWPVFMTASCSLSLQSVLYVRTAAAVGPFIRCSQFWEHLIRGGERHSLEFFSLRCWCAYSLFLAAPVFYFLLKLVSKASDHVSYIYMCVCVYT